MKDITNSISEGTHWTFGYGETELTVDINDGEDYYIAGYRNGYTVTGVLDYQTVRSVWIDDNSGDGGIFMIVVDCIGLASGDINIIKDLLYKQIEKYEINCRTIHIMSTHTHAGIDTLGLWGPVGIQGKNEKFMNTLYEAAVSSAVLAYMDKRNGELYIGETVIDDLQHDSRPPYVYNKKLTQIKFIPNDGGSCIRIINYAAHAEALRSQNTLISGDYPYYMINKIYEETGDHSIFIPGAIGGLIMTKRLTDDNGNEVDVISNVKQTGIILADSALAIKNETKISAEMISITENINIPLDNEVFIIMRFLGIISAEAIPNNGINKSSLSLKTQVSYLQLGEIKILMIPGEIFPELVYSYDHDDSFINANPSVQNPEKLSDIFGGDIIIFGLCDDEIGYIIPPDDYYIDKDTPYFKEGIDMTGRKHYEETNSVGIDAANRIVEAVLKIKITADDL